MDIIEDWKNKSGVYIITPLQPKQLKKVWCKIGQSQTFTENDENFNSRPNKGIGQRLDQYLLYYPWGFHVIALYQTKKQNATKLENVIHNLLRLKGRQMDSNHSHTKEWFQLNLRDITKLHQAILSSSDNYIINNNSHLFADNPQVISSNTRKPRQTRVVTINSPLRIIREAATTINTDPPINRRLKSERIKSDKSISRKLEFVLKEPKTKNRSDSSNSKIEKSKKEKNDSI